MSLEDFRKKVKLDLKFKFLNKKISHFEQKYISGGDKLQRFVQSVSENRNCGSDCIVLPRNQVIIPKAELQNLIKKTDDSSKMANTQPNV